MLFKETVILTENISLLLPTLYVSQCSYRENVSKRFLIFSSSYSGLLVQRSSGLYICDTGLWSDNSCLLMIFLLLTIDATNTPKLGIFMLAARSSQSHIGHWLLWCLGKAEVSDTSTWSQFNVFFILFNVLLRSMIFDSSVELHLTAFH